MTCRPSHRLEPHAIRPRRRARAKTATARPARRPRLLRKIWRVMGRDVRSRRLIPGGLYLARCRFRDVA